jgi:hypothetical protein
MSPPPPWATALARFRATLYATALSQRKDSLCDLLDAVLTANGPATLARLSLAPGFRRRWPSVPDALAAGALHLDIVRALLVARLPPPPLLVAGASPLPSRDALRPVWAVDGSTWPRPQAKTSPERTWGRQVHAGLPQDGVVPAWEYQWLVAVPHAGQSWVLPLDVARRGPTAGTPTELALEQLARVLAHAPPDDPAWRRPVATFDSSYDPVGFVRAQQRGTLAADALIRVAGHRRFYRPPPPYAGTGAPRKHGAVFRCKDPLTHGPPDQQTQWEAAERGTMTVAVWTRLHVQAAPDAPFTLVRVTMARLPRRDTPPQPLWLAWVTPDAPVGPSGAPSPVLPDDLTLFWTWYGHRFPIEHGFRFSKAALGWTTVRPRDPAAADRWTWLLVLAWWQLWLARSLVADQHLPWERPVAPAALDQLTPGRVRRAFPGLLAMLGTPARVSKPRGKSPGRRPGQRPVPHPRCAVVRRHPHPARPRRRQRPGRAPPAMPPAR